MDPWWLRMVLWARNPPSGKTVIVVLGVIALMLAIYGVERLGYWPDWATAERTWRGFR